MCPTCFCGISEFKLVTKEVCKLPSFFSTSIFKKIDTNGTGFVTRCALQFFWCNSCAVFSFPKFSVHSVKVLFHVINYSLTLMLKYVVWFYYRNAFIDYWINGNMLTMDMATQIYTILKQPDLKYLTQVFFYVSFFCLVCSTCFSFI